MIDLGQLGHYIGIHFSFAKEGVFVSQRPYIEEMLHMFGMVESNSTKMFMAKGTRPHRFE
jgi:hypothetical protein